MIGFYERNKQSLPQLIATLKSENIPFHNFAEVEDHIQDCCGARFLKRLYSECLFLQSLYLDYFNASFDSIENMADAYNLDLNQYKKYIDLGREIHNTITESN